MAKTKRSTAKTKKAEVKLPGENERIPVSELRQVKGERFQRVHANSANVAANFYDVMIMFGEVVPNLDQAVDDPAVVEQVASVTMSWEHAKALTKALITRINAYENEEGIVREPQSAENDDE